MNGSGGVLLTWTADKKGNYFAEFSENLKLVGVIVGSRSTISRRELEVAFSRAKLNYKPFTFKARLAFETFRVVKNRNEQLWD